MPIVLTLQESDCIALLSLQLAFGDTVQLVTHRKVHINVNAMRVIMVMVFLVE